jgi:hypothetical protein
MESKAKREGEAAAVVGDVAVVVQPSANLATLATAAAGEGFPKQMQMQMQMQRPITADIHHQALPVPLSAAVRPDPPAPAQPLMHPSQCKSCSDASARLEALQVMHSIIAALPILVQPPDTRQQAREMAVSQREVAVSAKEALVTSEARLQRETHQTVIQQQQQVAAEQARLSQLEKELSARSKATVDKEKALHEREKALVDRERETAAREARCEREKAAIERDRQVAATTASSAALLRRPSTAAAGVGAVGKTPCELLLPRLQQRLMLEDTDDLPPPQPQRAGHVPQPPPPRSVAINDPSSCPASAATLGVAGPRQPLPKRLAWNAGLAEQQQQQKQLLAALPSTYCFFCSAPMLQFQILKTMPPPRLPPSGSPTPGTLNPQVTTAFPFTFHRRGRISALGVPDVCAQLSNEAFDA